MKLQLLSLAFVVAFTSNTPPAVAAGNDDTAAIRACATKYADNVDDAERPLHLRDRRRSVHR